MIKGLLKSVFILGLTLLPISFSNAISQDYYSPFSITSRCLYEVDYSINRNGSFTSYYNGVEHNKILYFKGSDRNDCSLQQYIVLGRKNGKLYLFTRNGNGLVNQGYLNYYCYGSEPCGTMNVSSETMLNILNNQGVKGLYLYSNSSSAVFSDDAFNQYHQACLLTNSETAPYLCFYAGYPSNYSFSDSLNFNVSDWDNLTSFDGFFDNTPVSYNGNTSYTPGNNEVIPTDIDRYIEYYEGRYGRNINMCYVGTNDYTTNYGSGDISFDVGTGLTLNELYYNLYGTFGSNNIKNVGTFINVWLMNYEQWFYKGKGWIANYNGPDINVTYNYQDIDYPFLNKPVAIYFMSNNLYDFYRVRDNQGEEMAYYCQLKVNYSYFKANPDKFKEEEDKVDPVYTDRAKIYYNNMVNNNGSGKVGFQVPNLTGTLWGEVFSGNVLPEDLNPTNLFKDFFTKVTNLTETYSPFQNGILPDWIVYPLIFLVLFRIFRH